MRNIALTGCLVFLVSGLNPSPSRGDNSCFATLSADLAVHVPAVNVLDSFYAADLDYSPSGPSGEFGIWFTVADVNTSAMTDCSNPARFFTGADAATLRIPVFTLGPEAYWAELEHVPTSDERIWFRVTDVGPMPNRVFVTSVVGNGNLSSWEDAGGTTGLEAADAVCTARADAAGLNGTFVAWLSDDNDDAYCRIHGLAGKKADNCGQVELPASAGPWVRMDGFPFAEKIDRMLRPDSRVFVAVRFNEFGHPANLPGLSAWVEYMTNTDIEGKSEGSSCANWTSSSREETTTGGDSTVGSVAFTSSWSLGGCNYSSAALLCFEVGREVPLPKAGLPGKVVFRTRTTGNGDLSSWPEAGGMTGIAAGDAICRALAQAAGLANTERFTAWLSDNFMDAEDRITSEGPWIRPDGVRVADSRADLLDGNLFASINVTEWGDYFAGGSIWTGTDTDGNRAEETCMDWTSSDGSVKGDVGHGSNSNSDWSVAFPRSCDWVYAGLYCFED